MELERLCNKITRCIQNELRSGWTLLRDSQRCSITVIKTEILVAERDDSLLVKKEPYFLPATPSNVESFDPFEENDIDALGIGFSIENGTFQLKAEESAISSEPDVPNGVDFIQGSSDNALTSDPGKDEDEAAPPLPRLRRRKTRTTLTKTNGEETNFSLPSRFYRRIPGTRTYTCKHPKCGKTFNSAGGCYTHHLRVHQNVSKDKDKKCDLCPEAFFSLSRLRWHRDVWHPESIPVDSSFVCDVCGKILSCGSTLKTHRRLLHETKKINYFKFCRICHIYVDKIDSNEGSNDKCSFKASLLNHFVVNHPNELFVCTSEGCGERFVKKSQLNRHVDVVHKGLVNLFQCPHCAKSLGTSKKLSFHIDTAHPDYAGELNFFCEWQGCNKAFSCEDNLKIHFDGHSRREKEKINGHVPRKTCPVCSKEVAPTYLALHMRNAHGPKQEPRNCGECNAVCVSIRALKNHFKKFHSGIIYTCDICSKTFNYKSGLESHIERVHEKKRHKCTDCDKVYGGRKEMLVHYRAVHKGIRFPCRMCHREFLRGPDRNRHERSFHNIASE